MASILGTRSAGMLVLGIWLILHGVTAFVTFALPPAVPAALALIAGVLIIAGR